MKPLKVNAMIRYEAHAMAWLIGVMVLVVFSAELITIKLMDLNSSEPVTYFVWGLVFAGGFLLTLSVTDLGFQNGVTRRQMWQITLVIVTLLSVAATITQLFVLPLQNRVVTGPVDLNGYLSRLNIFPLPSQFLINLFTEASIGLFAACCGLFAATHNGKRLVVGLVVIWLVLVGIVVALDIGLSILGIHTAVDNVGSAISLDPWGMTGCCLLVAVILTGVLRRLFSRLEQAEKA